MAIVLGCFTSMIPLLFWHIRLGIWFGEGQGDEWYATPPPHIYPTLRMWRSGAEGIVAYSDSWA